MQHYCCAAEDIQLKSKKVGHHRTQTLVFDRVLTSDEMKDANDVG